MLSLLLVACLLGLSSCQRRSLSPLMSGRFVSVDIYPNAAENLKAYIAVWKDRTKWKGRYIKHVLSISIHAVNIFENI